MGLFHVTMDNLLHFIKNTEEKMKKKTLIVGIFCTLFLLNGCNNNKKMSEDTSSSSIHLSTSSSNVSSSKQSSSSISSSETIQSSTSSSENSTPTVNSKLLAAKVIIKKANYTTLDEINTYLSSLTALDADYEEQLEIWTTGVYLSESVTVVTASPLAGGMTTYHNNGDGTVNIYPLPSHYQDQNWDDPVKGKEMAEDVINQVETISIADVPDELAQPIADYMTGNI